MKLHRSARSSPVTRQLIVDRVLQQGWTYAAVGGAAGVSRRTVAKWVQRFRLGGLAALTDRSSRPGPPRHQTPAHTVALLRQLREDHGLPAWAPGQALDVPRSTVSAWLRRLGLNRRRVAPPVPVQRYEWPTPGDLIHLDIKALGRFHQAGHRVHGDRQRCSRVRAGNTSMSPSTITRGWPTSRSCRISAATAAPRFCSGRSPGMAPAASSAAVCSRTTAVAMWPRPSVRPARPSRSATGGLGPTRRAPKVRRSASSRLCCASGPTSCPTRRRRTAAALRPWVRFYNRQRPHASLGYRRLENTRQSLIYGHEGGSSTHAV
jgi:transposase